MAHPTRALLPLLLASTLGCALAPAPAPAKLEVAKAAAPRELPADPALLSKLRCAVAEVLVADPNVAMHAGPVRAALQRTAAREGFAVSSANPAPGDLVMRGSYDWTPPAGATDPSLFLSLSLERNGERIDEASYRQTEGFPQTEPELDALVGKLTHQLARSPRTQGYLKDLQ